MINRRIGARLVEVMDVKHDELENPKPSVLCTSCLRGWGGDGRGRGGAASGGEGGQLGRGWGGAGGVGRP